MRALTLSLVAACVAACSYPTGTSMYDVRDASVSFSLSDSFPRNGDGDVGLDSPLVLYFSDYPDPASVSLFGPITLRSGRNSYDFDAAVDLIRQIIVVRPKTRFTPSTAYTLVVTKGLLSLSGLPLDPEATVSFSTGTSPGGPAPDGGLPPPVVPRTLAVDVQPILDTNMCSADGCHSAGPGAMAGLDLSSVGRSIATLIDVPATEENHLVRVRPGDPAKSYLFRKLLGTPDIAGGQMPLGLQALDERQLRIINDWIATGAR
jgi:hypothetical protein